ncbi:MAG: Maf family protein [Bryobacterales bacterium]
MPSLQLVLASGSPRRRELLTAAGIPFTVRPASIDETQRPGETPADYVVRLAGEKARAAWRPGEATLGADTTVVLDGETLGKPEDEADAARMMERLAGRAHEVLTGYCVFDGERARTGYVTTRVVFGPMQAEEIAAYAASGEPLDKAGGYGIQGLASKFVERVEGCYFNVVGLPVSRVYAELQQALRETHGR